MSMMTGPKLDEMKEQLVSWWLTTRRRLIEALEEGYPYRSIEQTPEQQIQRFVTMQPADHLALIDKLMERHKGEPNRQELVLADLQKYRERMFTLMRRR